MQPKEEIKKRLANYQSIVYDLDDPDINKVFNIAINVLNWVLDTPGDCPYCGGAAVSSYKHADLVAEDTDDPEHTDVMIHRCGSCKNLYAETY